MPNEITRFSDIKLRDYKSKVGCQGNNPILKNKYTISSKDELFVKYAANIKNMIEICEKEVKNVNTNDGEDMYFSEAIEKYNYDFPPYEFRVKVLQENFPIDSIPIGIHQFWTFINR
jgi:hypothetical protein